MHKLLWNQDDRAINDSKIPLLGHIPISVNFLKKHDMKEDKTELLIFITLHVVENSDGAKAVTRSKESEGEILSNVVDWDLRSVPNLTIN